jgi:hypothetical protein
VIDPRKLRPTELCRLLNATPLGEAISERQLHRHREFICRIGSDEGHPMDMLDSSKMELDGLPSVD